MKFFVAISNVDRINPIDATLRVKKPREECDFLRVVPPAEARNATNEISQLQLLTPDAAA